MTEKSGPFDTSGWLEDDWARSARLWTPDCVEAFADGELLVSANTGMQSQVALGNAWVHGFGYRLQDANKILTHTSSTGTAGQSRNDLVVLHLDRTTNLIDARIITGTFAVTPTDPALVQNDVTNIWEMALARVNVVANATAIGAITDLRNRFSPPRGTVATVSGPSASTDYSAGGNAISFSFNGVTGRKYRFTIQGLASQVTTAGIPTIKFLVNGTEIIRPVAGSSYAASTAFGINGICFFTASTTGSQTVVLSVQSSAAATRLAANAVTVLVEDTGV